MVTFAGLTYVNGSVPSVLLSTLDGQPEASLRRDAAESWNRAKQDVLARTGVTLVVRGWNRTLAEQERFFFERYEQRAAPYVGPFSDVRWYKGRRYVRLRGASAAIPGTSNHGWGLAVDVTDYGGVGAFDYPRRASTFPILARHGWTDTEGRGVIQEPWHLVYDPSKDTRPIPEDNMPDLSEIHDTIVGILRAPEFALGVADRKKQTAEAVLGGVVTDDRTFGTQPFALVLGDIFAHARAAAGADGVDVEALADALAARLPKTDAQALLDALAARLES